MAWSAPQEADACSCFDELSMSWPMDDGQMAANDAVQLFNTCSGNVDLESVEVLVDGAPAQIAATEVGPLSGYQIEPRPAPGAAVELRSCPGWDDCDDAPVENLVEFMFTVGEEDTEAPPVPTVELAEFRDGEAEIGNDVCSDFIDTVEVQDWTLVLSNDPSVADEAMVYIVEIEPDGAEPTVIHHDVRERNDTVLIEFRRLREEGELETEVCYRVRAVDMAGHESEAVSDCLSYGAEPSEPLDRSSCSCTAAARPEGGAGMLLGLLGLLGLRRRRS